MEPPSAATPTSPHVIMFPGPTLSHCFAYIHLARKLCTLGINITLISIEHTITLLKATEGANLDGKLRFLALPNGERCKPSDDPVVLLSTFEERTYSLFENCLKNMMERSSATVSGSPEWTPPCCAIVDLFQRWTTKIIGGFKLPCYVFWTSTAASLAMIMYAPVLLDQGIIPVDALEADKLKPVEIPGIPPLHPFDFPEPVRLRNHPLHNILVTCARHAEGISGILVNSVYELEPSVFDGLQQYYVGPTPKLESIVSVGPSQPASAVSKGQTETTTNGSVVRRDHILHWLDNQPPSSVIYICFGSIATLSAAQLVEIASGLEASEQQFIWVVRPPPNTGLEAANWEVNTHLPSGFSDRTKKQGIVVTGWAPQLHILQHPAIGGFLTHCGWGSILESIGSGVPMLTWPLHGEQRMNARWLVEDVGAGVKVHTDISNFVTRDKLAEAVRLLMCQEEGQVAKSKVLELSLTLQGVSLETGSSVRNLKSFAGKLHSGMDVACAS